MHEIKHLAEEIREELDDAEKYAREAAKHTEDSPEDARTKDAGLHPTEAMQAVWNWEHERMLDRAAHVKTLLSMM